MPETKKKRDVSKSKLENRLFIIEGEEPQLKLGFKDCCSLDRANMLWLNYLGRYLERRTKKINYQSEEKLFFQKWVRRSTKEGDRKQKSCKFLHNISDFHF